MSSTNQTERDGYELLKHMCRWYGWPEPFWPQGYTDNIRIHQRQFGDCFVRKCPLCKDNTVELKAERNKSVNFFLEEYSDFNEPRILGWMEHLDNVDRLVYCFLETQELYSIDFGRLRFWWKNGGRERHRRVQQRQHTQRNLTVGRIVPIDTVRREVGYIRFFRHQNRWRFDDATRTGRHPARLATVRPPALPAAAGG